MREIERQQCVLVEGSIAGTLSKVGHDTFTATSAMKVEAIRDFELRLRSPSAPRVSKCPDDMPCCIAEGLYVGGIAAARNLRALRAAGISHVVNASPIVPCFHRSRLRYHVVPVFDDPGEDIMQFFESTNRYIAKGRRKGAVLVHCFAGQSRSVALLLAYLIAREEMTLDGALVHMRVARPAARPNSGFMRQLACYEASLCRACGCGGWRGACSRAADVADASSPRGVAAGRFPFDDRPRLPREASMGCTACTPSPQSSRGGFTPMLAGESTPIRSQRVPGFCLVTGFEPLPSRNEGDVSGGTDASIAAVWAAGEAEGDYWLGGESLVDEDENCDVPIGAQ